MTETHKRLSAQLKDIVMAIDARQSFDHTSATHLVMDGLREAAASADPKVAMPVLATFGKMGEVPALLADLLRRGAADAFVAVLRRTEADDACVHNCMGVMALLCKDIGFRKAICAAGAARSVAAVVHRRGSFILTFTNACLAVRMIAGDRDDPRDCEPSCRAALMEAGVPAALVKALIERKADGDRVADACDAMWTVAAIPGALAALGSAGAVPALIAALQLHKRSAAVAKPACLVLSDLISDDGLRPAMHARDFAGVAAVIDVVRLHADNATIVRAACMPLSRAGFDEEAVPLLARTAAPLLVAAMRRHSGDTEMIRDALATLNNCFRDGTQRVVLFRAGVLSAVVAALRHHRADGTLCDYACAILCSFLEPRDAAAELVEQVKRDHMAMARDLIQALRRHASRALVTMHATRALAFIIRGVSSEQAAELLADGVALAITGALRGFPRNSMLVEAACLGLDELMDKTETPGSAPGAIHSKILEAKVTRPVAAGLRGAMALDTDVAQRAATVACCLLARLTHIGPEAALLARFGSAADVTAALPRFKDKEHVISAAAFVLRCIATSPEARKALAPVRSRAAEALIEALRTHEATSKVVAECADVLGQDGFTGATISREAAASLVRALSHHRADAIVVGALGMAVQNLSTGNTVNASAFLAEGTLRAAVSAAAAHEADAHCVEAACLVIRNLAPAGHGATCADFVDSGACAVVCHALRRHRRDKSVASAACDATAQLAALPLCRTALSRAGALPEVIAVLKTHNRHAAVAGKATAALCGWAAAVQSDPALASAAAADLVRADAATLLASVLQWHEADEVCAAAAGHALQLILCDDASRVELITTRTFWAEDSLAATLSDGFDAASIPQLTALAEEHGDLSVLFLTGTSNVTTNVVMPASVISLRELQIMAAGQLGGDGMLPALVGALRRHPRNAELAAAACALMALLTEHDSHRTTLLQAGALPAVVGAAPFHTAGVGDGARVLPALRLALKKLSEKSIEC